MTPLTTKAAEIRAGLVAKLRRAVTTGEDGCGTLPAKEAVKVRPVDWHRITRLAREAAALIEQQAAELAEAREQRDREERAHLATIDQRDRAEQWADKLAQAIGGGAIGEHSNLNCPWSNALEIATTAESERDELLREKERLARERDEAREALIECEGYFDNRADADCDQDGFVPNKEMRLLAVVREAIASTSQDSGQNLADANSKSPSPSSQSERIAVLEAAGRKALRFIEYTESEYDITFDSGDALRAALAPLGEE